MTKDPAKREQMTKKIRKLLRVSGFGLISDFVIKLSDLNAGFAPGDSKPTGPILPGSESSSAPTQLYYVAHALLATPLQRRYG